MANEIDGSYLSHVVKHNVITKKHYKFYLSTDKEVEYFKENAINNKRLVCGYIMSDCDMAAH